jgi:hypothetical protein
MDTAAHIYIRSRYFLEVGKEVLDPSSAEDLAKIATYLSGPYVVSGLAQRHLADAVTDLLNGMTAPQQVSVLTSPNAVLGLTNHGQAGAVIKMVKVLSPEQQATVLSVPYAVRDLADNGQALPVLELVKAMKEPEQQAKVLAAPRAVHSLAANATQAAAVIEILNAMPRPLLCAVLNAAGTTSILGYAGTAGAVRELQERWSNQVPARASALTP